ncbi:hypothetical protein EV175_001341 [Coemansia sp. RSA 1933]|nr:hypothetical protein EV175_001341 [Coemansia sp. RSA 1933]
MVDTADEVDDIPSVDDVLLGYDKAMTPGSNQKNSKTFTCNDNDDTLSDPLDKQQQQQNDIIAMFSEDDNLNCTSGYQKPASQDTDIRVAAGDTLVIHDLDDDGSENASHAGFMDEESARNYQQILANRNASALAGKFKCTRQHEREDKGTGKRVDSPETRFPNGVLDSSSDSDDSFVRVRHGRPLRHRLPHHESDSEAIDEPDALDEHRIIDHRLRSSAKPKPTLLSRYEQARLRAQHSNAESEPDNSDLDQDIIKDTHEIAHKDHIGNIKGAQSTDRTGFVDMPETDSETERMPRKSVLVIHGSSEESDTDFISETEETCQARNQPVAKARMEKFLSAFEPKRRKQMHQRLELKNVLAETDDRGLMSPAISEPTRRPTMRVRGYSDALDDDLADFIVDEEEEERVDGNESELGVATNGNGQHSAAIANRRSDVQVLSDSDLSNSDIDELERDAIIAQMPEQFSQFDLPTSFKTYVQYLVYWLCNGRIKPELSTKNARYFYFAYITISRVIDSVEQSLVESSAWVDSFRRDLHRYPEIHFTRIMAIEGCDACHFRKNRTATFCLGLLGKPYDREELIPPQPGEKVTATSSETQDVGENSPMTVSGDDDSDFETGGLLRKRSVVEFNVGKTCKQRAETGHELHHYFYHLAHLVEISLSTLSINDHGIGIEEEDEDGGWINREPDDLVEILDSQGMVDKLFANFKDLLSRSKSGFAS